jgi:hypothetical protein
MTPTAIPGHTAALKAALPQPITRVLGKIDRRLRARSMMHGLGTVAIIAALGAVAGMIVDFAWDVPQAARWAIWGGWICAIAAGLIAIALRPLFQRRMALGLAALAEQSDGQLGERLTATVALVGGASPAHGSPALIAALAEEATARAGTLDPRTIVPLGSAGRRLATGGLVLALLTAGCLMIPDPLGTLARRFLAPWADLDRASWLIVAVQPGDTTVAVGSELKISARVRARLGQPVTAESAWLEWTEAAPNGPVHRVAMPDDSEASASGDDRAFAVALPSLTRSLTYRVASGSSRSRRFRVNVVEPPALEALSAHVEPPAYTKLPAMTARDPNRIEAWEGSRVVLTASANQPVRAIDVTWPGGLDDSAPSTPDTSSPGAKPERASAKTKPTVPTVTQSMALAQGRRSGSATLIADRSGPYAVTLHGEYDVASRSEAPRQVIVRPDAPPTVAVRGPAQGDALLPDDALRVAIAARDDVAVASVELHYTIERKGSAQPDAKDQAGHVAPSLKGLKTRTARGEAVLELSALELRSGDTVAYRVRVADNRPAPRGPNVVWSASQTLAVSAKAEPLLARQGKQQREAFQATLNALKKDAAEVRRETEQLRYAADAAQRGNGTWDKPRQQELGRREKDVRGLEDRLHVFARDLEANAEFQPLARPARQVAEVEAEAGRAQLDKARRAADAEARFDDLREADSRLGAVGERLEELQRKFDELAKHGNDRQRLNRLAEREDALARRAAELGPAADRARLDRMQAEQKAVENELDALLRESPDLRASVLEARAARADELAKRARTLADRQRNEARRGTDLSRQAAALKALAAEQRAIEDDARRLAVEIDRPLAENGRARVNTEALRQPVAAITHGDLDQGRAQLEGAENELRRLARDLEDVPADLKALAHRLARRQDTLNNQINEAAGEFRGKDNLTAAERSELADKLRPLIVREERVLGQLDQFVPRSTASNARFQLLNTNPVADMARVAAQAVRGARDGLQAGVEPRPNEARDALNRLADVLPDAWRMREPARKKLDEARRISNEVIGELERHLRETAPRPDQPLDPARMASDLANRLEGVARNQAKVAEVLASLDPEPRELPQRDRAARRARALADALKEARATGGKPAEHAAVRAMLPTLQLEARAALDRLERKMNGAMPADDLAVELAADQRAVAKQLDTPAGRRAAAADQRRLASALRNLEAPDAQLAKDEAVRLAEQAANALVDPKNARPESIREAIEGAEILAGRLADASTPRASAAALARAERALNDPDAAADPEIAERRQRAIAEELSRLPLRGKAQAMTLVERAADVARKSRLPEHDDPVPLRPTAAAVAEARSRAADALDLLAARQPADPTRPKTAKTTPDAAPDPDLGIRAEHALRAGDLVQRERRLRERLQAILADSIPPQQELRRESAALGRDLAELRDQVRPVSDRAQYPAQAAAQLLGEEAPRTMERGTDHLAAGRLAPARDEQRRAADVAERGAQQAEDLAAALRADRPLDAKADQQAGAQALGEARDAARQAARELGQARDPSQTRRPQTMQQAGQAMHQAAENLRTAARAIAQGQGDEPAPRDELANDDSDRNDPAHAGHATRDPHSRPAGKADADLTELQDAIRRKTGRTWGELPGHLRSEILQMAQGRYRDDYARLIQLYYREIASGATESTREPNP